MTKSLKSPKKFIGVVTRLDPITKARVQQAAKARGLAVSSFIRGLIEQAIS